MTTSSEYNPKYRVVPDWEHYETDQEGDVWRRASEVRCKGGGVRQVAARKLKVSSDGRVTLYRDGRAQRFHVRNELLPLVFPERPQAACRHKHPLMLRPGLPAILAARLGLPKVAAWGSGNRVCLQCQELPDSFDNRTYSRQYGTIQAANPQAD